MRIAFAIVCALGSAAAEPRPGANHRKGDDSFVAAFGRAPDRTDGETLRMKTHLEFVRAELAAKSATKPELAAKRTELLGYLDEYIAKGITPENTRLPWRSPVFIDDFGNICAVGYLIERSAGRAIAEKIAASHRYEFLEDIAAAMPEVRAWIDASGFTVDELASIQPGYSQPVVEEWGRWTLADFADGAYKDEYENAETVGVIKRGKMHGVWKRVDEKGRVIGKGKMRAGRGTWQSFYPDGKKLAEGPFEANDPHGTWTFFHASGRVAAIGAFANGHRHGRWKFFYDDRAQTPISVGSFAHGSIAGEWKHFDREGELLATSTISNTPHKRWETGFLLSVTRGRDGVRHEVHRLGGPDHNRVDGYYFGREKLYVHNEDAMYDANGFRLARGEDGAWQAIDCKWSKKRKRIAKAGDITTLHGLLMVNRYDEGATCAGDARAIEGNRTKRLEAIHASFQAVRAQSPDFVKKLALGEKVIPTKDGEQTYENYVEEDLKEIVDDLPSVLAEHMAWYIEWPHVDGKFIEVFYTLAGHSRAWGPMAEI